MIPTDLPLPRSSSNLRMTQREKDELAEQWYSMMIKDDIDSQHDISSIKSTMTRSISSNDQQEQRDPNSPRGYYRRGSDRDRLLDKSTQIRDTADMHPYRTSASKNTPSNKNSKTDFLDGIIQSLSELSKAENSASKAILQDKKNGWSIQDSQRRMQERRSRLQVHERNATAGASQNYQQQNSRDHGENRRESSNSYRSLTSEEHPVMRGRTSTSRHRPRMLDESDASQLSSSNYTSYSSGNSRSVGYSSGTTRSNSRSRGYSSQISTSEGYSSGSRTSRRSAQSMPMEDGSSRSSIRKEHSWNIDKSLKSNGKPLFNLPTSPESNAAQMNLPLESTSSLGSDKFHPHVVAPAGNRRPVSRDRTTSLASSSSKDAGKILQHFTMATSSGSVKGDVDAESYPSRSISHSEKRIGGSSSHSRRSYNALPQVSDGRIPKTNSQKELEREILRDMRKESTTFRLERDLRHSNNEVGNALNHFDAAWGGAERREPSTQRDVPKNERRFSMGGTKITPQQFGATLGSMASSVMSGASSENFFRHMTSCNGHGQESSGMMEKIQGQLTGQAHVKCSPFMTKKDDGNNSSEHERRIQGKLDAVRERSVRKFERSSSSKSEAENSTNKFQGRKFENLFDINTDVLDELATRSDPVKKSTEKHNTTSDSSEIQMAISPAIVGRNDLSHFKYVAYSQFGEDAQQVLKLCEHHTMPVPDRRKGEILIKILASTISAADCAIRRGEWKNVSMDPYIIPGIAFVGKTMGREKKKSRPSSSTIDPGDNVLCLVRSGANARYICLQKSLLIKVHPKLKPERVVCLAETYLTAFQALHLGQRGQIRYRENSLQGQSILVMNAYSPVGKAIIELSRLGGASICYGLVNDDSDNDGGAQNGKLSTDVHQRFQLVEEWGAIPLPANPQEWLTLIGRQIDILITSQDPKQGRLTSDHWKALKKEGQVHAICTHPNLSELEQRNLILGSSSGNNMKAFRVPTCRPGAKAKMADRAVFYNLFDSWEGDRLSRVMARNDLLHLLKLLESDLINPEVAIRVPLSKIAKAHRSLERNTITGARHLICLPWMPEKPPEQPKASTASTEQESQGSKKYII